MHLLGPTLRYSFDPKAHENVWTIIFNDTVSIYVFEQCDLKKNACWIFGGFQKTFFFTGMDYTAL